MPRPIRSPGLPSVCALAWLLVLLALAASLPRAAGAQTREFAGQVTAVSGGQLVVESRQGETLRFVRSERTAVEGRPGWEAIRRGDRVVVRWSLRGGPHEARRVIVLGGR